MPTNYDKWSKFATELYSDSDQEQEAEAVKIDPNYQNLYLEPRGKFVLIKPLMGGKNYEAANAQASRERIMKEVLEYCDVEFSGEKSDKESDSAAGSKSVATGVADRGFTVELHPDRKKELLERKAKGEKLNELEEQILLDDEKSASETATAESSKDSESTTKSKSEPQSHSARIASHFRWRHMTQQYLPGYQPTAGGQKSGSHLWRVFHCDCYLSDPLDGASSHPSGTSNIAARRLIGQQANGNFVLVKLDNSPNPMTNGKSLPVSLKEVADLILKRAEGGDAEMIEGEIKESAERMKLLEKSGVKVVKQS